MFKKSVQFPCLFIFFPHFCTPPYPVMQKQRKQNKNQKTNKQLKKHNNPKREHCKTDQSHSIVWFLLGCRSPKTRLSHVVTGSVLQTWEIQKCIQMVEFLFTLSCMYEMCLTLLFWFVCFHMGKSGKKRTELSASISGLMLKRFFGFFLCKNVEFKIIYVRQFLFLNIARFHAMVYSGTSWI